MVDAYWNYRDSAYFVETWGCSVTQRRPGIYYRCDCGNPYEKFQTALRSQVITSSQLTLVLETLESLIDTGKVDEARVAFDHQPVWLADVLDTPDEFEPVVSSA